MDTPRCGGFGSDRDNRGGERHGSGGRAGERADRDMHRLGDPGELVPGLAGRGGEQLPAGRRRHPEPARVPRAADRAAAGHHAHLSPDGQQFPVLGGIHFATRAQTMLFTDWNPTDTWANITNQNAAIDQMAASVKSLGTRGCSWPCGTNRRTTCPRAGTRTVRTRSTKARPALWPTTRTCGGIPTARFTSDGVRNVVWVMDYMNYSPFDCLVPDLWPGNDLRRLGDVQRL